MPNMSLDSMIAPDISRQLCAMEPCVCVLDGVNPDICEGLNKELNIIFTDRDILQAPAKMGSSNRGNWEFSLFRGDRICWVTPEMCEKLSLGFLQELLRR